MWEVSEVNLSDFTKLLFCYDTFFHISYCELKVSCLALIHEITHIRTALYTCITHSGTIVVGIPLPTIQAEVAIRASLGKPNVIRAETPALA